MVLDETVDFGVALTTSIVDDFFPKISICERDDCGRLTKESRFKFEINE